MTYMVCGQSSRSWRCGQVWACPEALWAPEKLSFLLLRNSGDMPCSLPPRAVQGTHPHRKERLQPSGARPTLPFYDRRAAEIFLGIPTPVLKLEVRMNALRSATTIPASLENSAT